MAEEKQYATRIVQSLRKHGYQAYFAGGCVRDLILGREPADYDVATDATPRQVMGIFPDALAVGEQFGVVLVPSSAADGGTSEDARRSTFRSEFGGTGEDARRSMVASNAASRQSAVEVATFRSDLGYSDGRHPDGVRFSKDPREDVQRRDFTINGMMLDPVTEELLDFVGGRDDLKAGIVRAIGDPERRFTEDKLRMLRGVRFAARFHFQIDLATEAAMERLAPEIRQVSSERVREELTKMLTEGRARHAFELLDASGLLGQVLPEIAAMKGVEQPPQYHPEGDVFVHTMLLLEQLPAGTSKTLAWGVLLHDVGKPPTFRVAPDRIRFDGHADVGVKIATDICSRLHFSNYETDQILALVANHMRFGDAQRMKQSTLKRFFRLPHFEEHMELHRMDCLSSHRQLDAYNYVREQLRALPPEMIRPMRLVTGADLIVEGHTPGPRFKEVLAAVEDAQLEGLVSTREAALEYVRRNFPVSRPNAT